MHKYALVVIDMQRGFLDPSSPLYIAGAADTAPACARAIDCCHRAGVPVVFAVRHYRADGSDVERTRYDVWAKGGQGGLALAEEVLHLCEQPSELTYAYPLEETLENKIAMIAKRVYGAKNVSFAAGIRTQLRKLDKLGNFPVCMAKTQYSLSDDPKKTGRPEDFTITVRQVRLSAGAGFVVAFTGEIIAMPGLPKVPAALGIDVDEQGEITGLF